MDNFPTPAAAGTSPDPQAGLWLYRLQDRDGFQRQAAVEALERLGHGPAIPALVARVNDWVPQVRAASRRALGGLLRSDMLPHWLQALEAVVALGRGRRDDHRELLNAIDEFFGRVENLDAFASAAAKGSSAVQDHAFAIQWRHAERDDAACLDLLRRTVRAGSLVSSMRALKCSRGRVGEIEVLVMACASPFAQVRAQALRRIVACEPVPAEAAALAHSLCFDRSPSVRFIALGVVRRQGAEASAVAEAVARLDRPGVSARHRAVALQFLWTSQPTATLRRAEVLRTSPHAVVRRAAFAGLLARVEEADVEDLMLHMLGDPSAKVQRLAVEAVRRGATAPPPERLMALVWRDATLGMLRSVFAVLRCCGCWPRLRSLLAAARGPLPEGGLALCHAALLQWVVDASGNFVTPTAQEKAELASGWTVASGALPEPLRRQIRFYLSTWGIKSER